YLQQSLGMLVLQTPLQVAQALLTLLHAVLPGPAQAHIQFIQPLALLGQALAGVAQASTQRVQPQVVPGQAYPHALLQLLLAAAQLQQHGLGVRAGQFRCGGGGGCAYIGDEVADGNIRLVADGADNRRVAGGDGAGHLFLVERPQILQGAATPSDDQCIKPGPVGALQSTYYLRRGLPSLYRSGADDQLDKGCAAAEYADDVPHRCAAGRGDHADARRVGGQGALALGSEQALVLQFQLERLERLAQRAVAGRLQGVENHLVVAAPFVQADPATGTHQQAVAQVHAHPGGILAEQGAAYLGATVLEGEIHVAGRRARQVGQLALDPDLREDLLQQSARPGIELADGQHLAFC